MISSRSLTRLQRAVLAELERRGAWVLFVPGRGWTWRNEIHDFPSVAILAARVLEVGTLSL